MQELLANKTNHVSRNAFFPLNWTHNVHNENGNRQMNVMDYTACIFLCIISLTKKGNHRQGLPYEKRKNPYPLEG